MKNNTIIPLLFIICSISSSMQAAAENSLATSPVGTGWTDYLSGIVRAGYGKLEKWTGTKPVDYCIDKGAQIILKNSEQMLELSFADNRIAGKTKTYLQLMNNTLFQLWIKQLNDRAYFDWEHVRHAIAEDRFYDVAKFWKLNRINLSPCLRTAIKLYLEQNKEQRRSAPNPKDNVPRFDLSRINNRPGYVEATLPIILQENAQFPELTQTIRDHGSSLTISSPLQNAERRIRKTVDPSFSTSYLTSAAEIEKAKRIYAVFFSYLFRTKAMGDSIAQLFSNQDFLNVYNQVWDRDSHLRHVLNDQLGRGSLDACTIYTNHKLNISPLFAALICDMMLSHEQQENARHVSDTFKNIFFTEKKPYGKYIFMFLNTLNKEQKISLFNIKDTLDTFSPAEQCAAIHRAVRADEAQLELLAEIQRGNHIRQLLEAIGHARVDIVPASAPLYPTVYNPEHSPAPASSGINYNNDELVLEIDLPEHPTPFLPQAGHSDPDEEETGTNRS